jgi:hypothetical protein
VGERDSSRLAESQLEGEKRDTFFSRFSRQVRALNIRMSLGWDCPIVRDCSRDEGDLRTRAKWTGPDWSSAPVSFRLGSFLCLQRTSFPPCFLGLIIDRTTRQVPGTFPVLPLATCCSSCVSLARSASPSRISLRPIIVVNFFSAYVKNVSCRLRGDAFPISGLCFSVQP